MSASIKLFEETDLSNCAQLFANVFNGAPWNESWHVTDAKMRVGDIFKSPRFIGLVARERDFVGFIAGNVIRIEHNDIFELKEMCVATDTQRKGIGSLMINTLKGHLRARQVTGIFLQTSHETPAYEFYKKHGFREEAYFSALMYSL